MGEGVVHFTITTTSWVPFFISYPVAVPHISADVILIQLKMH